MPNPTLSANLPATAALQLAPFIAATSVPETATIADAAAHLIGPFSPVLRRKIWLTLNATAQASGTAQLFRSTDGGVTQLAVTKETNPIAKFNFGGVTGVIVNEPVIDEETDAAATYYLSIQLTVGTVTVRLAQ